MLNRTKRWLRRLGNGERLRQRQSLFLRIPWINLPLALTVDLGRAPSEHDLQRQAINIRPAHDYCGASPAKLIALLDVPS